MSGAGARWIRPLLIALAVGICSHSATGALVSLGTDVERKGKTHSHHSIPETVCELLVYEFDGQVSKRNYSITTK